MSQNPRLVRLRIVVAVKKSDCIGKSLPERYVLVNPAHVTKIDELGWSGKPHPDDADFIRGTEEGCGIYFDSTQQYVEVHGSAVNVARLLGFSVVEGGGK